MLPGELWAVRCLAFSGNAARTSVWRAPVVTPSGPCYRSISISISTRQLNSTAPSNPQSPSPNIRRQCPECHTQLPLNQTPCPKCSTLLPLPGNLSHHSILNLSSPIPNSSSTPQKPSFDVAQELRKLPGYGFQLDSRDLRRRMLERQKDLHPDKFQGMGVGKDLAEELSGRVNRAYEVLVDPLRRAEYILSVHDLATSETDSLTDPGLLAEIMEAREELDEAETAEQVEALRQANSEKVEATTASILEAFREVPPNLAAVKLLTVQLKYWKNLEDAAKEWSPKL